MRDKAEVFVGSSQTQETNQQPESLVEEKGEMEAQQQKQNGIEIEKDEEYKMALEEQVGGKNGMKKEVKVEAEAETETEKEDEEERSGGPRERLKRHRREVAGHVWIPDLWGQEELLMDWIDCSAFDASLVPKGIISARASLIQEPRRPTSAGIRVQNSC